MHISEGVLEPGVLVFGALAASGGIALGLRSMKPEDIPKVALLTSAFFVASLIHVPVGPSSAHLILNGLLGVVLGWAAFPAIFIGLALQAVLFQFGGLTTLGINTLNMALPAVLAGYLAGPFIRPQRPGPVVMGASALAGAGAVMAAAFMVYLSLHFSKEGLGAVGKLIFLVHIPVAAIEGLITSSVVAFLLRVKPEVLSGGAAAGGPPGGDVRRKSSVTVLLLLLCLSLLSAPAPALAHKVSVFAWFDGKKVELEAYFASGDKARNSTVTVTDEHGRKVFEGKTDEKGLLSFVPPGKGRYHVVLVAGMGHRAETEVDVDAAPAGRQEEVQGPSTPLPPQADVTSGTNETRGDDCLSAAELERILDERLMPIQRQVMVLAEEQGRIRPHDVISGLGYILGLMGVAMYVSCRKKRHG